MQKVLIIGATGVFGKRLARHLADFKGISLIVTSRSKEAAEKVAAELRGHDNEIEISGEVLNTGVGLAARLAEIKPYAVIDCSGPFQNAGYNTAETVICSGSHMIDLADARDYLLGYKKRLDGLARENGVSALAGASSTPALSNAVVAELTSGMSKIIDIDIAIVPGGRSEVGTAVVAAVLSYAGRPVPVWRSGGLDFEVGWLGARIVDVPHLGKRRVAVVETADAELLPQLYEISGRVTFSAGLESMIEQRGLEAIAWLRRAGVFPEPGFLAPFLTKARRLTRFFCGDQGGMVVLVEGLTSDGKIVKKRWSLLAKNDHGPSVPILAAAAMLRKLLKGGMPEGASVAALQLTDIQYEMSGYQISTSTEELR